MAQIKNKEKNRDKQNANLEKGKWKKGQSGNPKGHPKGQRNFSTIYKEALRKLAKSQKVSPEALEDIIVQMGITKAMTGDFKFYQDLMDRINGKPVNRNAMTDSEGNDLELGTSDVDDVNDVINKFLNDTSRNSKKGRS